MHLIVLNIDLVRFNGPISPKMPTFSICNTKIIKWTKNYLSLSMLRNNSQEDVQMPHGELEFSVLLFSLPP